MAHEQPGYWVLLTSAQLAHLCQQVNTELYTDCKDLQDWLLRTHRVHYSVSGLTDLLHRLGFTYRTYARGVLWTKKGPYADAKHLY